MHVRFLGVYSQSALTHVLYTDKRGDQICIFGFSRGAYVARALAGMLCKVSGFTIAT